ncbi:MAG: heat shock protein HspQ [Pirellulales bacterium]
MIDISARPPEFQPGQLVKHRRYGYRGVVAEVDLACHAPDQWYQRNQTQPLRQQPWYHVLVHQTGTVTYAAQDNLECDDVMSPVEHPLVDVLFDGFDGERYLRNDRVWEGWSAD